MRTNGLMTFFGILAGLGGVPIAVVAAMQAMPSIATSVPGWWPSVAFVMVLLGVVGGIGLGVTGKGQDTHSTVAQVKLATQVAAVEKAPEKPSL